MRRTKFRTSKRTDLNAIQALIEASFPQEESQTIATLARDLSNEASDPPIKFFVAEIDARVIAYVSYSPVFVKSDFDIRGYILSPLAVFPEHQKQGIGSKLVDTGNRALAEDGCEFLLVYGDPDYYGRFGFKDDIGRSFIPPYPLAYPYGWLGMILGEENAPASPVEFDCVKSLSRSELWRHYKTCKI